MTTPPNRNADADATDAAKESAAPSHSDTQPNDTLARRLRTLFVSLVVCAALVVLHLTLIDPPYYWDEAGYFTPAAREIYTGGSFAPPPTLSTAPPPLVMAYLALA